MGFHVDTMTGVLTLACGAMNLRKYACLCPCKNGNQHSRRLWRAWASLARAAVLLGKGRKDQEATVMKTLASFVHAMPDVSRWIACTR
eukprot:scaffold158792_cov22-Tisochrysis_lutea.AAC.2